MGDQFMKNPAALIPAGVVAAGATATFLYLNKQIQELQAAMKADRDIMSTSIVETNTNMSKVMLLVTFRDFLVKFQASDAEKDKKIKGLEKKIEKIEKYLTELSKSNQITPTGTSISENTGSTSATATVPKFKKESKPKKKEQEEEEDEEEKGEEEDDDIDYKKLWNERKKN